MKSMIITAALSALGLSLAGTPARAASQDSKIESAAKKSYVFKHEIKDDDVKVESKNGNVVLTGSVAESSHKALAKDTVEDLPGVKSVDDRLEVKAGGPAEKSDAWITAKVKSMLFFHSSVSAMDTDVDTKDGVVALKGHADSEAQKELTAEYARDVDGVKSVDNQLTVGEPAKTGKAVHHDAARGGRHGDHRRLEERMDDASVTAHVKSALFSHRSTSAVATSVKTRGGVVTLTGKAHNTAEKDLVEKLAKDVKGVRGVNNRMTVE